MKLFFLIGVIGTGYGLYISAINFLVRTDPVEVALYIFAAICISFLFLFSIFNFFILIFEAKQITARGNHLTVSYYIWPDAQVACKKIKTFSFHVASFSEETGRYRARLLFTPPWRFVMISNRTEIVVDKDAPAFLQNT